MARLSWISDENLYNAVNFLFKKADDAQLKVVKDFNANVIDPFSALFTMSGFHLNFEEWKEEEASRKAQKTLQNHIGA